MKVAYTLRLPEELRDKIKEEAKQSKVSINQYILYTLTRDISYKEAERTLKNRIKRAPSHEEALRLLETVVPDVPPLPKNELFNASSLTPCTTAILSAYPSIPVSQHPSIPALFLFFIPFSSNIP